MNFFPARKVLLDSSPTRAVENIKVCKYGKKTHCSNFHIKKSETIFVLYLQFPRKKTIKIYPGKFLKLLEKFRGFVRQI